ncbi:MAG: hypothetical protein M1606_00055, partial [Candidatus Thermoplasmatota archaeon]|nr:hypothetical protein [Candidatus Thermoplasmatota archaeon]
RSLDVRHVADDGVVRLRDVSARERSDLDERRALLNESKDARVDLARGPVRPGPGSKPVGRELFSR